MERVAELKPSCQEVSRSFVLTLASPQEIFDYYNGGLMQENLKFSILRFVVAVKNSEKKGGGRLTLLGGKIEPYENFEEARQREIVEEMGSNLIPRSSKEEMEERLKVKYKDRTIINRLSEYLLDFGSYDYQYDNLQREAFLNAFFVTPRRDKIIGDPKIIHVRELSLEQIQQLVYGGKIDDLALEEHLRMNYVSDREKFKISEDDFRKRKESFEKAFRHFTHIEAYLKRKFEKIFADNPNITLQEFERIYWQEVLRWMRKGYELSEKRRKIEIETLLEGDLPRKIFEGLNGGFLGEDVLYFMPHIIDRLIEKDDLKTLLSQTTEATEAFFMYFDELIKSFFSSNSEFAEDFSRFSGLTLQQKVNLISEFDNYVKERLKQDFKINKKQINKVILYLREFWSNLEARIKMADSNLTKGLIQNYRLLNEVNNACLGKLILLFYGIDGYLEDQKLFQKQLRFEAGRQLLLFMKGILSINYFEKRAKAESMLKVNSAIESFFGAPFEIREFIYQDSRGEEKKIIAHLRKKGNRIFIIDEKPPKDWLSFIRKSFKEKPEDIIDFSSYSIVYMGEDKEEFIRYLISGEFEREFLEYLRRQFPKSTISLEEKTTFGLDNFVSGKVELSGKRTGSQAARIVAKKYILTIDGQKTELVIYPYYSTIEAGVDNNGLWLGWLEKRKDDDDYFVRRILAGKNGIPSFYDLLFPPEIYPHLYLERLKATYHL